MSERPHGLVAARVVGPAVRRSTAVTPAPTAIVAADGGLDHARAAGLIPDVLVGDLDSVSPAGLDWATANISVQRHPADKSATDTELALRVGGGDATPNASSSSPAGATVSTTPSPPSVPSGPTPWRTSQSSKAGGEPTTS